jgi:hypothetical protein
MKLSSTLHDEREREGGRLKMVCDEGTVVTEY